MKRGGIILFLGLLLIAFILRVPLLLSEHFVLDGDESIIGLMALDAVQNGDWWPLFWGQNYGFVLPEIVTVFPFVVFFGLNVFTVKLPLLLWFVIGVYFTHKSIAFYATGYQKWLLTFLLIVAPTWLLWSMRLRGGYLPSFAIAHYLIYLSLTQENKPWFYWLWRGFLAGAVFILQAIWLPGVLSFLIFNWWKSSRSILSLTAFVLAASLPWVFLLPFFEEQPYHEPSFFVLNGDVFLFNASVYLSYLERAMQGLYLHGKAFRDIVAANVFSISFLGLIAAALTSGIRQTLRKANTAYVIPSMLSIISLLLWSFFLGSAAPRYAIPLFGYALILFTMVWRENANSWLSVVYMLLIAFSASVLLNAGIIRYEDFSQKEMKGLIADLQAREISVAFTDNYLLQWQIMFYSNHEILACTQQKVDRIPWRIEAARKVYFQHPEKTALVQFADDAGPDNGFNGRFKITASPELHGWFVQ